MDEARSPLGDQFTTYRQYKADTDSIAGWLVKNALRCGLKISAPAPTTRLKGKARKQARDAATNGSYTINISDFGRLAKAIADFKPPFSIIAPASPNMMTHVFNFLKEGNDGKEEITFDIFFALQDSDGNRIN